MPFKSMLCRLTALVVIAFISCSLLLAQQPVARQRIVEAIDDNRVVTLTGNTHPLARAEFDKGAAPDAQPISRMMMLLSRTPEQQAALDAFVEEQQDASSSNYHRWLTPAEIGTKFGANDADVQTIVGWLQQQGFSVERVGAAKNVIVFSGSAGQVKQAFHTAIHKYDINGQAHWANAQDPTIPVALAPVVKGLVSLNNFPRRPQSHKFGIYSRDKNGNVTPQFTVSNGTTNFYALGPADFSTIYNTKPLVQAGTNGAGQTIAIVGRTNINLQDVTDFRTLFGLGAGNTSVVIDGPDPGIVDGDEMESLLDVQWSNAVAPGANVVFVTAADTESTSGLDLAAYHIIENNLAGVMSESYGSCEANLGSAGNAFYQLLWQQAAAQGITVVVSSGDNGSAGCDNMNTKYTATNGLAVNGLASTSYNVAVGGTDFDDVGVQATYWNTTNDSTTLGSAKSYIPERTWNETCAATATASNLNVCPAMPTSGTPPDSLNLWAGSGGASSSGRPKPAWQTGTGVPNDGARDLPDVSFFSAVSSDSRSFYVVCQADALPAGYPSCQKGSSLYFMGVGGTSAAAPSFAGIVALAQQKAGTRLGNINYLLYSIAATAGSSCTSSATPVAGCVFHDTVKGNISVPCQAGTPNCSVTTGTTTGVLVSSGRPAYTTTAGYDLATGLGSVDVANLANAIVTKLGTFTPTTTSLLLNGATTAVTANHGEPINVAVSVSPTGSTGQVSLIGASSTLEAHTLTSGAASWSTQLLPGGTYPVKAHYAGDGTHGASDSNPVSVTISPEASQTFVNLITWDLSGNFQTFTASTAPYGSIYVLRVDVADTAATISPTAGMSSKCYNGDASCPTGTITLTANGNALDGGTFGLNSAGYTEDQGIQLPAGTYSIVASYPGDASYNASSQTKQFIITKGATAITAGTPVLPPYEYGESFQVSALLTTTSSGVAPTGTNISFSDNGSPATIVSPTITPNAGGPSGYAGLRYSGLYVPRSVGAHSLAAQFATDVNYSASASSAFNVTVDKGTTSVSGNVAPNTATPSVSVNLSADIHTNSNADQPTGTVTFYDNGTPISGTVTYGGRAGGPNLVASLTAQLSTTFSQGGAHAITATYSGDSNYNTSTANIGTVTVTSKLANTLDPIQSSISPAVKGYSTVLTTMVNIGATRNLPDVTGTITFSDNGQALAGTVTYQTWATGYGSNTLKASMPYTFTAAGTHNITAAYSGDTNYATSSSATPLALVVSDKIPTMIGTFNPSAVAVNTATTLTAEIWSSYLNAAKPSIAGTVTFLDGATVIPGTAQITEFNAPGTSRATLPHTFTSKGTHNITVRYSGDSNYAPVESTAFTVDVKPQLEVNIYVNQMNFTTGGGSGYTYFRIYNNTPNTMNGTITCTPDSSKATCTITGNTFGISGFGSQESRVDIVVPAVHAANTPTRPLPFTTPIVFAGALAGLCLASRRKRFLAISLLMICLVLSLASCGGGGGNNPPPPPPPNNPSTYHFTITATSGSVSESSTLTATLQ